MSYPSYQAASSPGNVLFFTKKDAKKRRKSGRSPSSGFFLGTSFAYTAVVRNVFFFSGSFVQQRCPWAGGWGLKSRRIWSSAPILNVSLNIFDSWIFVQDCPRAISVLRFQVLKFHLCQTEVLEVLPGCAGQDGGSWTFLWRKTLYLGTNQMSKVGKG